MLLLSVHLAECNCIQSDVQCEPRGIRLCQMCESYQVMMICDSRCYCTTMPSTFLDMLFSIQIQSRLRNWAKKAYHSMSWYSTFLSVVFVLYRVYVRDWGCCCAWQGGSDIYVAMLNQTNVGHNNNKFYLIQVLGTLLPHLTVQRIMAYCRYVILYLASIVCPVWSMVI
jgi:hypothetical protein